MRKSSKSRDFSPERASKPSSLNREVLHHVTASAFRAFPRFCAGPAWMPQNHHSPSALQREKPTIIMRRLRFERCFEGMISIANGHWTIEVPSSYFGLSAREFGR
jgi:hypothetical protein